MRRLLEVCVDDGRGLDAAIRGGADRIELCAALALGGLTPSQGLMAAAAATPVPVYAMIRPAAGAFWADAATLASMRRDIRAAAEAGLAGVVLGTSRPDFTLDVAALADLCGHAAAHKLGTTLHRAFDLVSDPLAALEAAIDLGFERILTSGGALSAPEGADTLAALNRAAGERIAIMPGAGVRPEGVAELVRRTGVREVHASCSSEVAADPRLVRLGFAPARSRATDAREVAAMRRALDELS